jgi:hypothetical protein
MPSHLKNFFISRLFEFQMINGEKLKKKIKISSRQRRIRSLEIGNSSQKIRLPLPHVEK